MYQVEDMKNCPFCGGEVSYENDGHFRCKHDPMCFLLNSSTPSDEPYPFTFIPNTKRYVESWNNRPDED